MSTPWFRGLVRPALVWRVCGFIRDRPTKRYGYAQSPRPRAAAGDKSCTHAIKKPLRSVVHYPARQPDVSPAELGEQVVSLNVPRPALRIGPVMGALEVDAHEILRLAHIDSRDDEAVLVEHSDLCLRPREAGPHEEQASERFVGRLGATVH
jgi:hypothetical protein